MKTRNIQNHQDRERAIKAIMALEYPYIMGIGEEKPRSTPANSRYWALLQDHLDYVAAAINAKSEETGYTPLEIRKLTSKDLPAEKVVILFALKKEAVHDALKLVCGVDTSTRLGTKKFKKFEAIMDNMLDELQSDVLAFNL